MIITNNDLNSMPQQVEENKNNIKILANYLKEAYKTSSDLGDSAVSIAISDTNATADTIDGWLITHDGYLYKITNGDGTNLLLEYYTYLRGETGANGLNGSDGADGTDGTNGTDGTSMILLHNIALIEGYSVSAPYTDFNTTPKVNDIVLDDNSIVGIVQSVNGTHATIEGLYSIKGDTGANGTDGADGTTYGLIAFSNIAVDTDDFVSSSVYTDYPYECVVLNTNQVVGKTISGGCCTFDVIQANSGNYASVCDIDNTNGDITIYAKEIPVNDFTILSIWCIAQ